jgi:heme-degrading monooxygenase HmoA
MYSGRFADTPQPPYYAVIFTSLRNQADPQGYDEAAQRMVELAAQVPGFLGVESTRDADGVGITVSYWTDAAAITDWRTQAEHASTRERGRWLWYQYFHVRVTRVERAYDWTRKPDA